MLRSWILDLINRPSDLIAIQSMHTRQTPRLGGIAIFGAIGLGVIFSSVSTSGDYADFFLVTSLLFFVGLAEDLGFQISPRHRLLAAVSSSLLIILVLGFCLPRTGIPIIDIVIDHWAVGIPLTVLVTVGISNGFNLIDGVNGLASLTGIVAALALSQIAEVSGFTAMVHLSILMAAGILGFFIINYPFGLIFLGDAGAYIIGFVLSWFGIAILINIPDVSPWAILLTLFWPVADTLIAIYRRSRRRLNIFFTGSLTCPSNSFTWFRNMFLWTKPPSYNKPIDNAGYVAFDSYPISCRGYVMGPKFECFFGCNIFFS